MAFEEIISVYTREGFRRAFRMYYETFATLLDLAKDGLQRNIEMGLRAKRPVIEPNVRLAITLRMLAGGSYLDLQTSYRIGSSTIYEVFHSTCDVLMQKLRIPGLSSSRRELERSAFSFMVSRAEGSPLSGCVGALDGVLVKIKMPRRDERPAAFYCRKGYYAVPVQALVDSNYRFLCYSGRCVGATHDSQAHAVSSLGMYLQRGGLDEAFWICGDDAYTCSEWLITPYPNSQATAHQKNFNYFLSVLRVHVEQAFGMLVARWRILRDGLDFDLKANTRIICLAMKLHNFCLESADGGFEQGLPPAQREAAIEESRRWYVEAKEVEREYLLSVEGGGRSTSLSAKRDLLCEHVRVSGRERPILRGIAIDQLSE